MSNPVQELFSRRLRRLRERKDVTMVDLAAAIGMSQATISEWEKENKFPRSGALQHLAIYFNVPMEYFFKEDASLNVEMMNIPLYRTSLDTEYLDYEGIEYIGLPASTFKGYSKDEEFIAFDVMEESMNLLLKKSSQVVGIRLGLEDVKDEDIVLFSYNDKYDIRRIRRNEENEVIVLSSESSDKNYYDIIIPFSASGELEIIAKIIWYSTLI